MKIVDIIEKYFGKMEDDDVAIATAENKEQFLFGDQNPGNDPGAGSSSGTEQQQNFNF